MRGDEDTPQRTLRSAEETEAWVERHRLRRLRKRSGLAEKQAPHVKAACGHRGWKMQPQEHRQECLCHKGLGKTGDRADTAGAAVVGAMCLYG